MSLFSHKINKMKQERYAQNINTNILTNDLDDETTTVLSIKMIWMMKLLLFYQLKCVTITD